MKKKLFFVTWMLILAVVFASCSRAEEIPDITGKWRTENVAYYTETTFNADGTVTSVYKVTDAEKSIHIGISQEMLDAMENTSYYIQVPMESLTEEERAGATGEYAIKVYPDVESMENDENFFLSFYTLEGKTLTLDECIYTKN